MICLSIDERIDRPIDAVFARLADISGYQRWMPRWGVFIESKPVSPDPVGRSTAYWDKGRFGTFWGIVEEFEAPRHIVYFETLKWLGQPVWDARLEFSLEERNGGTLVHHVSKGTGHGPMRLMEPVMSVIARGERQRTMTGLKESFAGEAEADSEQDNN